MHAIIIFTLTYEYIFHINACSLYLCSRRPVVNTLYDVFCNIRDDEGAHVQTMVSYLLCVYAHVHIIITLICDVCVEHVGCLSRP